MHSTHFQISYKKKKNEIKEKKNTKKQEGTNYKRRTSSFDKYFIQAINCA